MSASAVVTARIDGATLALVDKVAGAQGRSRSAFVAEAVRRVAESEADFLAFVQVGIDDLDAGRTLTHEQLVERVKARRQARQAA